MAIHMKSVAEMDIVQHGSKEMDCVHNKLWKHLSLEQSFDFENSLKVVLQNAKAHSHQEC